MRGRRLVTTRGFGDILHIGYQNRPRLFDLAIKKREPLFTAVAEIDERIDAEGNVLRAPDAAVVRRQLEVLRRRQRLAGDLLVARVHARRSRAAGGRLRREAGFEEISVSHQVAPLVKIVCAATRR